MQRDAAQNIEALAWAARIWAASGERSFEELSVGFTVAGVTVTVSGEMEEAPGLCPRAPADARWSR